MTAYQSFVAITKTVFRWQRQFESVVLSNVLTCPNCTIATLDILKWVASRTVANLAYVAAWYGLQET